ncbi:MAG: hypothetical protein Q4G08_03440 [Capnocytophaga sp.]|nr:hypothetical protein [Capnocytophaga sp.]
MKLSFFTQEELRTVEGGHGGYYGDGCLKPSFIILQPYNTKEK